MARRSWALKVVDDCVVMADAAQQRYIEIDVIQRAVDTAVMNLSKHVKALDQKNADAQAWSMDMQKEQDLAGTDWERSIARVRSVPASTEMIRFITGRDLRRSQRKSNLEDLLDAEEVKRAGKLVRVISTQLGQNSTELGRQVDSIIKRTDDLFDKLDRSPARSAIERATEPAQLMQDIEAIGRKVSNDYESVLGYANNAKSISQASKSALLHTKNFLPNLTKRTLEMDEILRSATEVRNSVAAESVDTMHDIASLTGSLSETNEKFKSINLDGDGFDAFNLLSTLRTLPVTYASFVAEAIRRREWNEKVRSDSSTLANEMATFQDEEGRRRRKWQKNIGTALWGEKAERKVMGLEVNLHGEEEEWPPASRQELEEIVEVLRAQDAKSPAVTDVSKILLELNNPTKQQSKRAKAFKNGSIHEAALGRSALLMRGDDDLMRAMQDEKVRVESKLKTAESRVRRLEDLLHRQTNVNRTSTGNVFQLPGMPSLDQQMSTNPMASPRPNDDISRRSSVSSRRFSANQGQDEKVFQQKLLSLEAELIAERERTSGMEKEISAKTTSTNNMKAEVEEANSMKKDLMENFEAQQREFIEERRSLESEIKRLKAKLEELEDEIDRNLGSRENERTSIDDRVRSLLDELESLRKEKTADAQKAQGQVDYLRNNAKIQRETNEALENQVQNLREANKELRDRAGNIEMRSNEYWTALQDVHSQLTGGSTIPADFNALRDALVSTSGDVVAELESIKSDAVIARADRDEAQSSLANFNSQMAVIREKLSTEEAKCSQLRETLAAEQARFTALEVELNDERTQLAALRTKIADGETGSEALRSRLEEEERKVTSMSEDLAARQSRIGGLEEESRIYQEKSQSIQAKHDKLSRRFEARTGRAKDLTQRVYAQNDRLCRLLERLSYSVTREGGSMVIQRLPKPDRSTANIGNDSSDPGSTRKRSISGAVTRKAMVDSGDLDLLYWMHNEDSGTESEKYDAYLNAIGSFDVETFCEVITKRIKDTEYTAKKYSKDARAYREKSHVAQKEAHEKIAFKNFKEGDLALFLPTRNQATGAWAAFNVGAPHYFLREQDSHKLRSRDWLLARIHKIEDRVVDLSKSMSSNHLNVSDGRSFGEASNGGDSFEDDNPFDLSDGLRWYLIDAAEEKPGAPSTPGLAKSTVQGSNEMATGTIERRKKKSSSDEVKGINKTLSKSLDSRRSSTNSKRAVPAASPVVGDAPATATPPVEEETGSQMIRAESRQGNSEAMERLPNPEVRNNIDELLGP